MSVTVDERADSFTGVFGAGRGLTPAQRTQVEAAPPPPVGEGDVDGPLANADGSFTTVKDGYTTTSFYLNGKRSSRRLHRDDGPAQIAVDPDGTRRECWYQNGVRHRDGGPAAITIRSDGRHSEFYYVHGQQHREDGPAHTYIDADGTITEEYYERDRAHCADGPAVIVTYPHGRPRRLWYRYGRQLPSNRLLRALKRTDSFF